MRILTFRPVSPGASWWELTFRYDADLISCIKASVERGSREWDPDRKLWRIRRGALRDLIEAVRELFPDARIVGLSKEDLNEPGGYRREEERTSRGSSHAEPTSIAEALATFFVYLPLEVRANVSRAIRSALHPDRYEGRHNAVAISVADVLDNYKEARS